MNSIIVVVYFLVFIIISINTKENIKSNKVLTYLFIYLTASLSTFIIYFLYLYSELHKVLPLIIGVNFILTASIIIPLLIYKKTYENDIYKLILLNITKHIISFFIFLTATLVIDSLFNNNFIIQIIILLVVEAILIFLIYKLLASDIFTTLKNAIFIISFSLMSIAVYETPQESSYNSEIRHEEIEILRSLEYTRINIENGTPSDIVIDDNNIFILYSRFNSVYLTSLYVYNLETDDYSLICKPDLSSPTEQCTSQFYGADIEVELEYYNGVTYFYSQNGLYYINDELILTEIIAADDVSRNKPSLLYLKDNKLIYESTESVYEVNGITASLVEGEVSQHSLGVYPYTENLILITRGTSYSWIINGITYSGLFDSYLVVYTETLFTASYKDTTDFFISIDGEVYDLTTQPRGVLEIDDEYYVITYINSSHVLINPKTSEIVHYFTDRQIYYTSVNFGHNVFISMNHGDSEVYLNEIVGFNSFTIIYEQARFYNVWQILWVPIITIFGYAILYEVYEDEEQ